VALRLLEGASGLGSQVSIWLGPPCIITMMTDLPVVSGRRGSSAEARPDSRPGNDRPARLPTVRKSRRVAFLLVSKNVNMRIPPGVEGESF